MMVWGGMKEEGSGWGTHIYLWQINFDIWQNQYNIVKLNKIKLKKNGTGQDSDNWNVKLIKVEASFILSFISSTYLVLSI